MPMPTFRKSPPELVARFGELAELAGDADRKHDSDSNPNPYTNR